MRIPSIFYFPATLLTILRNLSIQRNFLLEHIQPLLISAQKENDGSLDADDFKKINSYYGLAVPAILGEAFCALHEKRMTAGERMASTCQGAMTGLFDDFFDEEYLSDDAVENLITQQTKTARSNEKLFDIFYKKAIESVEDKKLLKDTLLNVHEAQVKSKRQAQPNISTAEIKDITLEKGGASLIFYRSAILPEADKAESELLYEMGGVMQMANDIFDIYKDREKGISTSATTTRDMADIRRQFQAMLATSYRKAIALPLPLVQVKKFLSIISLAIFSRVFVCLDQLEDLQKLTGGIFNVNEYSRKQLICDMDTKKNMLRSAAYHIKEMSSITG